MTMPADGATLTGVQQVGATVSFAGTSPGVRRSVFYLNGQYLITDFSTPYLFDLPTTKFVDGSYVLEAEALLRDGFTSDRASLTLSFQNGIPQPPVNTNHFTPTAGRPQAPGTPFVVAAAGDGAGGEQSEVNVSHLIDSWNPNLFLYLGDVYEKGSLAEYYNWYGPSDGMYGNLRSITDPTIGNHEYTAGVAAGYFDYWDNVPHYYSYNAGGWHFISLDSNNNPGFQGLQPGTAQYTWLANDLQANNLPCTIAYFHHPLYNIGDEGPSVGVAAIWALMEQNGVDIVLNGHDHTYQRWTPMDANGNPIANGLPEFIVGTGGHALGQLPGSDSRMKFAATQFGAFRLELNALGAAYRFQNTSGAVLDSGSVPCRGLGVDSIAPSVPSNLTTSAPWRGEVDLAWTESTDNVGVTGYDVYRDGSFLATTGPGGYYQDLNVTPGTTYSYQVRARDAAGNVSALSNAVTETTPALTVQFSDGFEGGLGQWINNGLTLQGSDVFSGASAVRATSAANGAADADHLLSAPLTDLYYETRFKVFSQGANSVTLLRLRTATTSPIISVYVSSTSRLGYRNDVTGIATTSTTASVTLNTWHTVQLHAVVNGATSMVEVWLDGLVVGDLTQSDALGANAIARLELGESSTTRTFDVAMDDVAMDQAFIPDVASPSIPGTPSAVAASGIEVDLSWAPATDDVGVIGYEIVRDGDVVATVGAVASFIDTTVAPHNSYSFQVRAFDAAGNHSPLSGSTSLITPAVFTDDFESGDLSHWTGGSGLTVQQALVDQGAWSARATTSGTAAYAYSLLAAPQPELYYRLRFDLIAQGGTSVNLARMRTATGGAMLTVLVTNTGRLGIRNDVTGVSSVSPVAVGEGWHDLQFHLFVVGAAGEVEVWLDGVPVAALTQQDSFGSTNVGRVEVGDSSAGHSFDAAFDGVLVDTNFIGDSIPPSAPADLAITSVTAGNVGLSWTAAADDQSVDGYLIYRDGALVGSVGQVTSFQDSTVALGATYAYTVKAFDGAGNLSPASAQVSVTVVDTLPPTAPTLSATSPSATEVDLKWVGATDDVGVSGYIVQRDADPPVIVGSVSGYQDTVAAGSTHTYAVVATDAAGNASPQSNSVTITARDLTPPSVPAGLTATGAQATRIDLSWTASTDNVGVATYLVYRAGVQVGTVNGPATTYSDTGLAPLTSYSYTVAAQDAAGNTSARSAVASATTPADSTPPTPPVVTATALSGSQVGLAWSGATDDVGIWRYTIYRNGKRVTAVGGGAATFTDTGLQPATTYTYTLIAQDAAGNQSAPSTAVAATTLDTIAPTAPTNLTANLVAGPAINLAWNASTDNVGVTGYLVFRGGLQVAAIGPSPTAYVDSTVPAGTSVYTVKAIDAAGNTSASSNQASVTIPDTLPPAAPTNLSANAAGASEVDLNWTASTDNGTVAGYRVFRDGTQVGLVAGTTTTYADHGVAPNSDYTYSVRAYDTANNLSDPSSPATAHTPADTTAPTSPTAVSAVASSATRVTVSWSAATDDVGVVSYTVSRNDGATMSTSGLTYADSNVQGGTTYSYTVTASDAAGNVSPASPSASATTPLFTDGFEGGNLAGWNTSTGMTAQTQQVHTGSYAARATSQGSPTFAVAQLGSEQSNLYATTYFRVINNRTAAGLLEIRTASGTPVVTIYVTDKGKLAFVNNVTGAVVVSPQNVNNQWHQLKVHLLINGGSGQIQVLLDGSPANQMSVTGNFGTLAAGQVLIGDRASGRNYDVAFDDVVADNRP